GVIAVLASAGRVTSDCLDVALRRRADPHLRPGRRDDDRPDPPEGRGVPNAASARAEVCEATTDPPALDPRVIDVDVAESARPGVTARGARGRLGRRLLGQERSRRRVPASFLPDPLQVRVKMLIDRLGRLATGFGT